MVIGAIVEIHCPGDAISGLRLIERLERTNTFGDRVSSAGCYTDILWFMTPDLKMMFISSKTISPRKLRGLAVRHPVVWKTIKLFIFAREKTRQ